MFKAKPLILGRKDSPKYLKVMKKMIDETGLFWHALPDRGFGSKGKQCKGGKNSKQRVTVAFFVSAAGKKEKPISIWRSENPRCLHRFDKSLLLQVISAKTTPG